MTKEFLKSVLSVPTCSKHECLMKAFIETWCRENSVSFKYDSKGNMFLTKGHGPLYPCCTSHLDTVFFDQKKLISEGKSLDILDESGRLWCRDTGIGTDCKAGIAICLDCMKNLDSCKCALFVEEEIGMQGSRNADYSFFDDVAWVLGFDSPEYDRASKMCSGTILYSADFFESYIEPVCYNNGVFRFLYEPWTDIKIIREKTGLECLNIGNGGRDIHEVGEYDIVDDTIKAADNALELLKTVPNDSRHISEVAYIKNAPYTGIDPDEVLKLFKDI